MSVITEEEFTSVPFHHEKHLNQLYYDSDKFINN